MAARGTRAAAHLTGCRGSAVASFALAAPLVIGLMVTLLQITGYVHTVSVARSAADEAARQASRYGGDPATARADLLDTLAHAAPGATVAGLTLAERTLPSGTPLLLLECTLSVEGPLPFTRSTVMITGRAVDEGALT